MLSTLPSALASWSSHEASLQRLKDSGSWRSLITLSRTTARQTSVRMVSWTVSIVQGRPGYLADHFTSLASVLPGENSVLALKEPATRLINPFGRPSRAGSVQGPASIVSQASELQLREIMNHSLVECPLGVGVWNEREGGGDRGGRTSEDARGR